MRHLLLLLALPFSVHAADNCWIGVSDEVNTEIASKVGRAVTADAVAAEKKELSLFDKVLDVIGIEPAKPELSAEKLAAVDVLKRQPDTKATADLWRKPTVKGVTRTLYSVYVESVDEAEKVAQGYGEGAEILGCWDWASGAITHPVSADLIEYMPDIVTYDENGAETSRTRPTEPSQTHVIFGQGERQWQ